MACLTIKDETTSYLVQKMKSTGDISSDEQLLLPVQLILKGKKEQCKQYRVS
jgi:hypothetical protein